MLSPPLTTFALPVAAMAVTLAAFMILIERRRPAWRRAESPAWWSRALLFNAAQVGVAVLGVGAWQTWFSAPLLSYTGRGWLSVASGYLLVTFVYYWWHRARHQLPLLWKALHRFHHSPTRVEVLTSFYKHPLELIANSILTSALLHRLHHARGLHHYNYSDLPLWDALFGTLRNPRHDIPLCGFPDEHRVIPLLLGRDVRET